MHKHYGQIVEYTIRRKNYNLSNLALKLKVNRRTIYNWFNQAFLNADIIFSIGVAMDHDFSFQFPELFSSADFKGQSYAVLTSRSETIIWKEKYLMLLEHHRDLLSNALKVN
ncbi:MAG: hypothetical protein JKY70_13800 [Mucilaginibacter sp.]|nr:hypothetical protein [Mucilaginibacter sp.]